MENLLLRLTVAITPVILLVGSFALHTGLRRLRLRQLRSCRRPSGSGGVAGRGRGR